MNSGLVYHPQSAARDARAHNDQRQRDRDSATYLIINLDGIRLGFFGLGGDLLRRGRFGRYILVSHHYHRYSEQRSDMTCLSSSKRYSAKGK